MSQSRRDFISTSSLALAGLLTGCAGFQLHPWQIYPEFTPAQHRALEVILTQDGDGHSQREHQDEIESNLVTVYTRIPTSGNYYYAATGLHLTEGIILTVDHVIDDTLVVNQHGHHFVERNHRERQITGVLARHPHYDLALIQTEDPEFLDSTHIHIENPAVNTEVAILGYQNNRIISSRTSVLSDSHDVFTTQGNHYIDMFHIGRNYSYGWSGAAVISRATGYLIGLVSSSPNNERRRYTSCTKVSQIANAR